MPPHTTLHYTMPPNTTNSKSTATTANNGTTQMNTNNKSAATPTKTTSRQRRATSGSSYVFAPSWLANLNNKSGPSSTVLNSAYVSTSEEKAVKEEVKGVGASKKEGLGGIRHAKEGLGKGRIHFFFDLEQEKKEKERKKKKKGKKREYRKKILVGG